MKETAFDASLKEAGRRLQDVGKELGKVKRPRVDLVSFPLMTDQVMDELKKVPTGNKQADEGTDYIYIISGGKGVAKVLSAKLKKARGSDDVARINPDHQDSLTLYVGRSKKLRCRLRQHLGSGASGVYSLHLGRLSGVSHITLEVSYMEFKGKSNLLVQSIEEGIWESLRPAFGRKGAR